MKENLIQLRPKNVTRSKTFLFSSFNFTVSVAFLCTLLLTESFDRTCSVLQSVLGNLLEFFCMSYLYRSIKDKV